MSSRGLIALIFASLAALPAVADTYGKLEHVRVMDLSTIEVTAKLDSGAGSTSLHAVNVKYFQRDGDTWVRFTVDNGSVLPGNHLTLERLVLKDVKVKQPGGGIEHRPIVEVDLCLGDRSFKSKLSVTDRTGYTAPLLIGTEELAKLGSVDTARQYTHEPSCKAEPGKTDAQPASGSASKTKPVAVASSSASSALSSHAIVAFQCDGRTMCSQMHSCDEAKFFINNCPNTTMDGNKDGVPCEKQWCH